MRRPGNPNLSKHHYQKKGKEPLNQKLTVRISPSMQAKLKAIENYPDFVRDAIALHLQNFNPSS